MISEIHSRLMTSAFERIGGREGGEERQGREKSVTKRKYLGLMISGLG